jgi:glyoxylase-like metal-dependent hydrolase (beta-lactamase superfamily II)
VNIDDPAGQRPGSDVIGSALDALYAQVRAVTPAGGSGAEAERRAGELRQVAPGVRVLALRTPTLPPATHTNAYLIGPADGPVAVVDPGSPYPEERAALERHLAAAPVARILLTHHHGDHVGGAAALAARLGVPVAAHAATARRLAGRVAVTELIEDGQEVHGAIALHTPGHAEGHLCFEVGSATIAGDLVAGLGTILIDPSEGDMATYLASLERVLARPAAALLPAHGPLIPDGHGKLREYLAHRRMREARVREALPGRAEAGATAAELVPRAYPDTPPPLWPLAERSLLAHLIKLRDDGWAEEREGRWRATA